MGTEYIILENDEAFSDTVQHPSQVVTGQTDARK